MKKRIKSQPEALLDDRYHGEAPLVGSMAFFNFVTEQGVCQFKNQHVEFDIFLSFNEGKSFIVTYQLLKASCHEKTALIIWLILGGIYVIGKCLTSAFNVKQIIFYSQRFM